MNKGFQSLPEHVQKKIDPDMARKYEDGGEAESRRQQVINKAIELFGDASEFSIMKVLKMLSGPMPMSFAAEVVNRAQPQAAENLRNAGSELMGKVGQAAQTVGGYTLAPYIAKGIGFDRAANALGLPYDDEGNMIPGRMPKYPPENKADGGAVMQRPLFRNMGGPAAPIPQDMAPSPMQAPPPMAPSPMPAGPEQEIMAVEQSMEGVGRNYVENMVGGIDAAEDVTSMINALRGNEAPLEARYAELAGYVGEADASQTPESVLAMVQPTILMTEEGAVDSGIGQLMQGIAGSDMETPTGDPTAMGQGVGELMAMGAGSTPPVNFNQGGPVMVRKFQDGTPRGGNLAQRATALYPGMQELYSGVLGSKAERDADLEEQKRLSQAQVFFDIAQTALAAGAPTATPMSAAERIAGAVGQTQLFDKMGQRSAGLMAARQAQKAEDRQLNMAALTGAMGEGSRQLTAEAAYKKAIDSKTSTNLAAKMVKVVIGGESAGVFNINSPTDAAAYDKLREETDPKNFKVFTLSAEPGEKAYETIKLYNKNNPTDIITKPVNTSEERAVVSGLLEGDYITDDKYAAAVITDEYAQKREVRAELRTIATEGRLLETAIAAEKRAEDTTLASEDRAVNRAVAKELRAVQIVQDAENRLAATTLASEGRAEATTKLREARSELALIRQENREIQSDINKELRAVDIKIQEEERELARTLDTEARKLGVTVDAELRENIRRIAAEERALGRKLNSEDRAVIVQIALEERALGRRLESEERQEKRIIAGETRQEGYRLTAFERRQGARLEEFNRTVEATIDAEERALGRKLDTEERAQRTFELRAEISNEYDLSNLAVAQGLKDQSQISKEDRAAIVSANNFARDQEALIAKELRAIENGANIDLREINGQLFRIDKVTGEKSLIGGELDTPTPVMAKLTVPNEKGEPIPTVVDITSPRGKLLLEKVNASNRINPNSASYEKVATERNTPKGFVVPGEGVVTSYDGRTFVDSEGVVKVLAGTKAVPVSDTIIYDVIKNEKRAASATKELQTLDAELASRLTDINGKPLSAGDISDARDAFAAARKGTGFWSKVFAGIDAVAGGVIGPEFFGELFKDNADARQFTKMIRVLGRSALAASPRFAVADLQTTEQLFPNEQALLANPLTEANKLTQLSGYLLEEKGRILTMFSEGAVMDSTMKATLNQKLFEIRRLESLIQPIEVLSGATVNQEILEKAKENMRKKKK